MNPMRGEAPLEVDGQRYTLVMDYNALVEAEDAADKPFPELMRQASAQRIGAVRALFYASLRRHHKLISLSEAGDILSQDAEGVAEALAVAIACAFPDDTGDGDSPNPLGQPKPATGSGPRSKAGAKPG